MKFKSINIHSQSFEYTYIGDRTHETITKPHVSIIVFENCILNTPDYLTPTSNNEPSTRNTNQYRYSSLWIYESIAKWITQPFFGWFLYQVSARFRIAIRFSVMFLPSFCFIKFWFLYLELNSIFFLPESIQIAFFCSQSNFLYFFLSQIFLTIIFILLLVNFIVHHWMLNQLDLFVELIFYWFGRSFAIFYFHLHPLNWRFCFSNEKNQPISIFCSSLSLSDFNTFLLFKWSFSFELKKITSKRRRFLFL